MGQKLGRNDPCPCGSGKKYKKCCGAEKEFDFSFPQDCLTGTVLDDYMRMLQGLAIFGQGIRQFDADGKKLTEATRDFEKRFRPGEPDGVTDGVFMSWLHFDLRFGKSQDTIVERFLKSQYVEKLRDPGPQLMRNFADSYLTFYEIRDVSEGRIVFSEIGTDRTWNVHRINEPYEREAIVGDVWYVRFVGPPEDAFIFTSPYILPASDAEAANLYTGVRRQESVFLKSPWRVGGEQTLAPGTRFRESCKASVRVWVEWFCRCDAQEEDPFPVPPLPEMQNTDGEPIMYSTLHFRIKKSEGLRERLTRVRNLDREDGEDAWTWFKKGNREFSSFPSTSLATLKLEDDYLIAETNSIERALRLRDKLLSAMRAYLSFERMDTKDTAALLREVREKKTRAREAETTEKVGKGIGRKAGRAAESAREGEKLDVNSLPEVRAKLRELAEEYYDKDWLRHRIPALGNKTPFQAVKTPEGRKKVEALLADIEKTQEMNPDNAFTVDVNGLRKKLGLV